jgi:hypothetical protein
MSGLLTGGHQRDNLSGLNLWTMLKRGPKNLITRNPRLLKRNLITDGILVFCGGLVESGGIGCGFSSWGKWDSRHTLLKDPKE